MKILQILFGYLVLAFFTIGLISLILNPIIEDWKDYKEAKKKKTQNELNSKGGIQLNIHIEIKKDE